MFVTAGSGLPTTVRLQSENGNFINGDTTDYKRKEKKGQMEQPCIFPQLSRRNPPWLVRTESNVRKAVKKKADPPCVECQGTGKINCFYCSGTGRRNCIHLVMLPKGEWPEWCDTCGGSGLFPCYPCMGTGERKDVSGFNLPE